MLALLAAHALAGDVKVLSDAAVEQPPGVVKLQGKKGESFKIGLVRGTDVSTAGTVTIVEKYYEDLCTAPCTLEMPVGWHELHVSHEQHEWVRKVEILPGQQTYTLQRYRPGMMITGLSLTSMIITAPIGVPLLIKSWPSAKRTEGIESAG